MKNKSVILCLLSILSISLAIIIIKKRTTSNRITIGILQTASHPALDAAREGFIAALNTALGHDIEYVVHNAQGSIITAHTIAERFHTDDSIDAIYAIATPALQAIASLEKTKPIFIAAVTDPYALGIIEEKTNICGTTDMIDIPSTIRAITTILPHVTTIALIYNLAENNSVMQIAAMEKELHKNSITTIHVGVTTEMEIPHAIASALSKADALLIPTDNLIASALPLVSHLARSAHKPLIACHNQAVEQGALMARGIDYYESGKQTARIALAVLRDGKKPYTLSITPTKSDTIVINTDILNELGITITEISDTINYVTSQK